MNRIYIKAGAGNRTREIVEILASADEGTQLSFERGQYHFYPEGCCEAKFCPLSNKNGVKRVIFPILGKKHLLLDGNGAEFIFHGRVFPFVLQNSEEITLQNFTVDCAEPRYFPAVVAANTEEYFDFRFDRTLCDFEVRGGDMLCRIGEDTVSSAEKKFFLSDFDKDVEEGAMITSLMVGDCSVRPEDFPADGLKTDAEDLGGGIVRFRYRAGSPRINYTVGHRIVFHFDEDRENDTIFADGCRGLHFCGVSIVRGPGMGLIAQFCRDIELDRVSVCPREGRGDLVAITADGFQFGNCRGNIRFTRSRIEKTLDDAVNVFGVYMSAERTEGRELFLRFGHREQSEVLFCGPGDWLNIVDRDTLEIKESVRVAEAALLDSGEVKVTAEVPLRSVCEGDYVENFSAQPRFEFTDNRVELCPSILLSTSAGIRFARNTIHTRCAGLRLLDSPYIWYTSSRVKDAQIEENEFNGCGEGYDESVIAICEYGDRHGAAGCIHENIVIQNNRFAGRNGKLLSVSHAKNVVFRGNSFRRTAQTPFYEGQSPYSVHHCEGVRIENTEYLFE